MTQQTKEEAAAIYLKAAGHVVLLAHAMGIGMSVILALAVLYASATACILITIIWFVVCSLSSRAIKTAKYAKKFISSKGRIPLSRDELIAYIDADR